ncbi:MAG: beta-galactosidase [Acidobacteria bacterium]|nr:beta-galactosidase [Acidobacteriota bacterium]
MENENLADEKLESHKMENENLASEKLESHKMENEKLEGNKMKHEIKGLPFGIQYYRAPTPFVEEWETDLQRIKDMGFTMIQVRPQWRWHERREGEFVWDDLDHLFDVTARLGLGVMVQFMLETAPTWVYQKHECYRVDLSGNKILPSANGAFYVGGWLPCFDHEGLREEGARFLRVAVERYRDRDNLLLWEAWNEPRSRPVGECCCPTSRQSYRRFVQQRHGSIEAFNDFFGKAYDSFAEIEPPSSYTDYSELWLWRQWAMESAVSRVEWAYQAIRSADDTHPTMAHVGANSLGQDILGDSSDDWATARVVDFYGTSLLFFTGDFLEFDNIEGEAVFSSSTWRDNYYVISMGADWLRSVSPYYWINEIYTNSFFYTTPDIEGDDLRFRIWPYVVGGAKGVVFWQYKSERVANESGCAGLVGIGGEITERAQACAIEAKRIYQHADALRDFQLDAAQVAIVYDIESDLASRVEETNGGNFLAGTVKYTYKSALKGAYNLFWQAREPVDFVSTRELEKIFAYRLVYLPEMLIADERVAQILKEYVEQGGMLIAEEGLGLRDKRCWMSTRAPGAGLDELFGVLQIKTSILREPVAIEWNQLTLPVTARRASLQASGGDTEAQWAEGGAAVVTSTSGKGKTLLMGFHPGICYTETRDENYIKMARGWLRECDIQPLVEAEESDIVQWRAGHIQGERAIFLLNYEAHTVRVKIKLDGLGSKPRDLFANAQMESQADGLTVMLPPREVCCLIG